MNKIIKECINDFLKKELVMEYNVNNLRGISQPRERFCNGVRGERRGFAYPSRARTPP